MGLAIAPAASYGGPLQIVDTSPAPSATDGKRYVVWVGNDGSLRVRDTATRRTQNTSVLCAGPQLRFTRVTAGFGLAVVQCGQDASTGRHHLVNLRTRSARVLALPNQTSIRAVGRYWIRTGYDATMYYVNRATREVRTVTTIVDPQAEAFGVLDVDTRQLRPTTLTRNVSKLLLSGALEEGSHNGPFVRDPRRRRAVALGPGCPPATCSYPFGRIGRLVYTRDENRSVVFLQRGKRTRTWQLKLPFLDRNVEPYAFAQLTDRELVVATPRQDTTYKIRIATL